MSQPVSPEVQRRREQNRLAQRRFRGEPYLPNQPAPKMPRIAFDDCRSRSLVLTKELERHGRRGARTASVEIRVQDITPPDTEVGGYLESHFPSLAGSPSEPGGSRNSSTAGEDAMLNHRFGFGGMCMLPTPGQELSGPDGSSIEHMLKAFAYEEGQVPSPLEVEVPSSVNSSGSCNGTAADNERTGVSPLHMAVHNGYSKIVRLLLEHGADCNVRDADGLTPLAQATIKGYEDIVDVLLSHGAGVHHVDRQGRSALHWAVLHRRDRLLKKLLERCVDDSSLVDGYTNEGRTPLHIAINEGFEAGVELLLKSGASVQCMARHDKTTNDMALEDL